MWEQENEAQHEVGSAGGGAAEYGEQQEGDEPKPDGFEHRGQSWYVATDVPSDLLVRVGDVSFHLHKYPLVSRSGRLNRILYESAREMEPNRVELDDLPGGAESFELAAKFCYGIAVDLTAANISALRCAAEYLEMTEDLEEGNLVFKTEAFLSYVVLSSWRDSIIVLKSCEPLSPWAENLQIVRRCSESIAWKACANPRGIRWAYTGCVPSRGASPGARGASANGSDSKDSSPNRGRPPVPADWWFEDVSILRIDHFVRVVTAIKVKGMRPELIGAAIMYYASKWLPGMGKDVGGPSGSSTDDFSCGAPWSQVGGMHMIVAGGGGGGREQPSSTQTRERRMMIESLISIIPPHKDSVSCSFLLRLLRLANMLTVAPALVTELEKRVGMQLEQASLGDLLIPSYNRSETLYDVDLVRRLVEHFLVQEQTGTSSPGGESPFTEHGYGPDGNQRPSGPNAKLRVARLLDSYLTEVSRDRSMSLTKFQVLAEALPESARSCDDGLYRAVDSYLKAHPTLTEHERKRLCRVMDCQKLSIDACMHAAQNERLPLRVVVQVLFSEQVKISNAIASSSLKDAAATAVDGEPPPHQMYQPLVQGARKQLLEGTPQSFQEGWTAAKKDINTLKFELESMKAKYLELQNDMDSLQRQYEKLSLKPTSVKHSSAWTSGWKKLSKLTKITTDGQEVVSHPPTDTVVEEPQQRQQQQQPKKGPRKWRNSIS